MKVRDSVEIAAPPEKVWPLLVDPENILKWCITFRKFEYSGNQHSGVGTTFYIEEKAGGPLMKLNFRAEEWQKNRRLTFRMVSGNSVKLYRQVWTIDPIPSGSRFIFSERVELPYGFIGKLMELFARRGSEATVKKMLAKLKNLAEA